MLFLIVAVALTSDPECKVDADCVLRVGCGCECCPQEKAMTKAAAEADRLRCAQVGECSRVCKAECPERKDSVAVCKAGRCEKLGLLECFDDSDCVLRRPCDCACCKTDEAMTREQARRQVQACAKLGPCEQRGCDPAKCAKDRPSAAVCRNAVCDKVPKER